MREPLFIRKNKDKWESYDSVPSKDPDVLSDRLVNILDDLAYAQTFYPRGKTVKYLNERAVKFYNEIYKRKKEKFSRLFDFWRYDLPLTIRKNHRFILLSFVLFTFFYLYGLLSAWLDNGSLDFFLGRDYVNMTEDNIREGNPFGVYGSGGSFFSFLRIAMNNILLAFVIDFIGGIFFGLGTLYSLLQNGMMVGAFHYMFYDMGFGWQFLLVVYIHGTFELFAIVLAAGAGFRLCNGLLFPGTYKRVESVKKAASEGMKLMIITFLLLLVAAFLEGFVTRLTAASVATTDEGWMIPIWASILLLVACFGFIIWYFIIYPLTAEKRIIRQLQSLKPVRQSGTVLLHTA
jgi:uncharacterized membrane protein SpoIIM required for sporulation